MNAKEDARVRKTKAKLIATFRQLLIEKNFEDITVNELCELSDVRRATFYTHFADKYVFLKYFVGTLRDDFDRTLPKKKKPDASSTYYTEYIRALVNFLIKNEIMVNNALASATLPTLVNVISEKNYEDTCIRLRESVKDGMTLPASVEITAAMMTGAVASTLLRWFKNGRKLDVEVLIEEISAVIAAIQN